MICTFLLRHVTSNQADDINPTDNLNPQINIGLHSESEMAFLSQEPVSIKNSKLTEGALVQLVNSTKPESTKRAISYRIKRFQQ